MQDFSLPSDSFFLYLLFSHGRLFGNCRSGLLTRAASGFAASKNHQSCAGFSSAGLLRGLITSLIFSRSAALARLLVYVVPYLSR